jgi:hypothetical protein
MKKETKVRLEIRALSIACFIVAIFYAYVLTKSEPLIINGYISIRTSATIFITIVYSIFGFSGAKTTFAKNDICPECGKEVYFVIGEPWGFEFYHKECLKNKQN